MLEKMVLLKTSSVYFKDQRGFGVRGDPEQKALTFLNRRKRKQQPKKPNKTKQPQVHAVTKLKLILSERHGEHVVSAETIPQPVHKTQGWDLGPSKT